MTATAKRETYNVAMAKAAARPSKRGAICDASTPLLLLRLTSCVDKEAVTASTLNRLQMTSLDTNTYGRVAATVRIQ